MNLDDVKIQASGSIDNYAYELDIDEAWISYRHPDYPLNSASHLEQRFNMAGQAAFYLASGNYCGQVEVPKYYQRLECKIKRQRIRLFDLPKFSFEHGLGDVFVQQRNVSGWNVCQEVSDYLTSNFAISGVLYQSAALHKKGEHGYCAAIIPGREKVLSDDFFYVASGSKLEPRNDITQQSPAMNSPPTDPP